MADGKHLQYIRGSKTFDDLATFKLDQLHVQLSRCRMSIESRGSRGLEC